MMNFKINNEIPSNSPFQRGEHFSLLFQRRAGEDLWITSKLTKEHGYGIDL
jgi:hypothetical protein